jgi:hypothetical protein
MALRQSTTADQFAEFLAHPKNSVWLALDREIPIAFIRYEGYDLDGVAIMESAQTIGVTGRTCSQCIVDGKQLQRCWT